MTPTTYLKLGAVAVVVAAAAWGVFDIVQTRKALVQARADIATFEVQVTGLQTTIAELTVAKSDLDAKAKAAEALREKSRKSLEATIARLRNTPVPKTCDGAMDWMMEQTS